MTSYNSNSSDGIEARTRIVNELRVISNNAGTIMMMNSLSSTMSFGFVPSPMTEQELLKLEDFIVTMECSLDVIKRRVFNLRWEQRDAKFS